MGWWCLWNPATNNLKRGNPHLALGLLFDSLWYLGEALFLGYRVTPFKYLNPFYICIHVYNLGIFYSRFPCGFFKGLYCFTLTSHPPNHLNLSVPLLCSFSLHTNTCPLPPLLKSHHGPLTSSLSSLGIPI